MPGRTLSLAALAVDTPIDGAPHEGVSARVISRQAKVCEEPRIRDAFEDIGPPGRARLGCRRKDGASVAAALTSALRKIPRGMHGDLPPDAGNCTWELYGIQGRALEADEYVKARTEVAARVQRLVAPHFPIAA